jgi:hypothetical protein
MTLLLRWSQLLQDTAWAFELNPGLGRITLRVRAEDDIYPVDLRIQEDSKLVIAIMAYKQKVDPDNRDRMLVFMNKANFEFTLGGFEMDPDDGTIRYRNSLDVESLDLSGEFVDRFVRTFAVLGSRYWKPVKMILDGKPVEDAYRCLS